mgnify:FL=1
MISRVLRYSYVQAKARAMKGALLTPEDWRILLRMKSVGEVLTHLGGTRYAEALSSIQAPAPGASTVSLALHDDLFGDYRKLLKAAPAKGAAILQRLLVRYEAENLKTLLRGLWQGKSVPETAALLYRLGNLSRLPVDAILGSRDIPNAIKLLAPTPFHTALSHALPRFRAQGSLFPLEVAVDSAAVAHVRSGLRRLGGADRKSAEVLIGMWIDLVNLSWMVRFRHFYDLSPEEVINYILPGGWKLGLRDLGAAARAGDLPSLLAALPSPYREALQPAGQWERIPSLLDEWFIRNLCKAFYRDPFQVRLPLSYLFLKEIEVKTLVSLLSAIELGEPTESLADRIRPPTKAVGR